MSTDSKPHWDVVARSLLGITTDRLWRLLKKNEFAVDPIYYPRIVFHTLLSCVNTALAARESRIYGSAIEGTEIAQDPIFILGFPRSGTTFLHNLLALDDVHFTYPNTFQVAFPFSFLQSESLLTKILASTLPESRPMDNMAVSFHYPQEDEFALQLLSFCSPYLWHIFPRFYDRYFKYLSFDHASAQEVERWKKALVWFTKKLTFKHARRLVLKSPFHTARIKHILEIFPNAHFIHIYRNPYTVYQSFRHMNRTLLWYMCLQHSRHMFSDEYIINIYATLHDCYFRDESLIPTGHLHEIQFEVFERDPLEGLRKIYQRLGLQFESVEPRMQKYLASIAGYEKNVYPEMPQALKSKLAQTWQRNFEIWGYPI